MTRIRAGGGTGGGDGGDDNDGDGDSKVRSATERARVRQRDSASSGRTRRRGSGGADAPNVSDGGGDGGDSIDNSAGAGSPGGADAPNVSQDRAAPDRSVPGSERAGIADSSPTRQREPNRKLNPDLKGDVDGAVGGVQAAEQPSGIPTVDDTGGVFENKEERRQAERVAGETDLELGEIARVEETEDGRLRPVLTNATREERAREQVRDQQVSSVAELSAQGNRAPLAGIDVDEDLVFEAGEEGVDIALTNEAAASASQEPAAPGAAVPGTRGTGLAVPSEQSEAFARRRAKLRSEVAAEDPRIDESDVRVRRTSSDGDLRAEARVETVREEQGPTRDDLDPLTAMAVPDGPVEDAAAGEARIEQLAEDGSPSARVFQAGSEIQAASQEFGARVKRGADSLIDGPSPGQSGGSVVGADDLPDSGSSDETRVGDVRVGRDNATVSDQVASLAGGFAEFPGLVAGGIVQTASIPGVAAAEQQRSGTTPGIPADTLVESTARGARQQAALVRDRPVEAAGILAPAAVASGRARVRARSGSGVSRSGDSVGLESQTRPGGRLKTEAGSLRERGPRSDISDFRTQTQASRQARKTREAGLEFREGLDRFIQDESGQAQLGGRRSQSRSRSRSESQETVDVAGRRQSPDLDPRVFERNRGRGPGRAEAIDLEVTTRPPRRSDRSSFREDVQRARQQPETDLRQVVEFADAAQQQSGSNVVPGAVTRLEEAQAPTVPIGETTLSAESESTGLGRGDITSTLAEQAQEPELDIDVAPDVFGDDPLSGGQTGTQSGGRSGVDTGVGIGSRGAVDTRVGVETDTRTDQLTRSEQRSAQASRSSQAGGNRIFTPPTVTSTTETSRSRRNRGLPGGPFFGVPSGGRGGRGGSAEFSEDEIFPSGILTGEEAFNIFFGDESENE